jgi:internalin A
MAIDAERINELGEVLGVALTDCKRSVKLCENTPYSFATNAKDMVVAINIDHDSRIQNAPILTSLPQVLYLFQGLRILSASFNRLSSIDADIGKLVQLERLDLRENKIARVAPEIGRLAALTDLTLWQNPITRLPDELCSLTRLKHMFLRHCHLASLPTDIGQLKALKVLDVRCNRLRSLPASILDLKLPFFEKWITHSGTLAPGIFIEKNPLESPPMRTFLQGRNALKSYFATMQKIERKPLTEAKLMIVGNAEVGKTSLAKKLLKPDAPLTHSTERTIGIDVTPWTFAFDEFSDFRASIWDFGGQIVQHSLHRYFFTNRSVYVVVVSDKGSEPGPDYWLDMIGQFAPHNPVVVVMNRITHKDGPRIPDYVYSDFPNVRIVRTEDIDLSSGNGIDQLITKLQRVLLEIVRDRSVPNEWQSLKKSLSEMGDLISDEAFLQLCNKQGIPKGTELRVSQALHDTGNILHFQDHLDLANSVILNREWVTKSIYSVLMDGKIRKAHGIASMEDFERLWRNTIGHQHFRLLVGLMKLFKVCIELNGGRYLLTDMLPDQDPQISGDQSSPIVEFAYERHRPYELFHMLMVRVFGVIESDTLWKRGFVASHEDTKIKFTDFGRVIRIVMDGGDFKRNLEWARNELRYVEELCDSHVKSVVRVQCLSRACKSSPTPGMLNLDDLADREKKGYNVAGICDVCHQTSSMELYITSVRAAASSTERKPRYDEPSRRIKRIGD